MVGFFKKVFRRTSKPKKTNKKVHAKSRRGELLGEPLGSKMTVTQLRRRGVPEEKIIKLQKQARTRKK